MAGILCRPAGARPVNDLCSLSLAQARSGLAAREFSATELTRAYLDRIAAVDGKIGAYLLVTDQLALEQAAAADDAWANGEAGPLTGIPIALKDVLATRGIPTTCASRILENFVPPFDAHVVARLRAGGAVFLGFLPGRRPRRFKALENASKTEFPAAVFCSARTVVRTLQECSIYFGEEAPVVICRELTKRHEEIVESTLSAAPGLDVIDG